MEHLEMEHLEPVDTVYDGIQEVFIYYSKTDNAYYCVIQNKGIRCDVYRGDSKKELKSAILQELNNRENSRKELIRQGKIAEREVKRRLVHLQRFLFTASPEERAAFMNKCGVKKSNVKS